eukprot:14279515-Alexandrium_andersonii.AAC.1
MSASLVGSEMCIRDRARTGSPSSPPSEKNEGAKPKVPMGDWLGTQNVRTVSYTHLTLPTICSV